VKDDFAKKKCSDFESDGFSCVPFHGCLAGEIITNGATIINIRGLKGRRKKRSIDLGPLDAKCFCGSEICCRHPKYNNVSLEIDPGTLKDVSGEEKCTTTTTNKPTTMKTTPAVITDKPTRKMTPTTVTIISTNTTESPATTVSNTSTKISIPEPAMTNAAITTLTSMTVKLIMLLVSLAKYV
jgi:hypothetical protein